MAIKSKARHDLTLRSIKRELAAGRDVAFWLDKAYTHYDNGLMDEADIAEVEALAQAYYDALDADGNADAADAAGGVATEGAEEAKADAADAAGDAEAAGGLPSSAAAAAPSPEGEGLESDNEVTENGADGNLNGRTRVRYGYARWGWTRGGGKTWHGGIDLEALDDTTIRMPFYKGRKISGKVTRARIVTNKNNKTWEWGYYICVQLDANQTPDTVNYLYFCHCEKLLVQVGQKVSSGDALAVMGRTGNAALGDCPYDHCHLEVRATATGKGLDPTAYAGCDNAVGIYGTAEDAAPAETGEIVIDVSYHQGVIDWTKVPYRALVRIGYRGYGTGKLMKDEQFDANLAGAKAHDKLLGFYFFSQAITEDEARAEADFCASVAPTGYPLFFDAEWSRSVHDGRADSLTKAQRTACAQAFCKRAVALGYQPGVYTFTAFATANIDYEGLCKDYIGWLADTRASYDKTLPRHIHQFGQTAKGGVPGIGPETDLNRIVKALPTLDKPAEPTHQEIWLDHVVLPNAAAMEFYSVAKKYGLDNDKAYHAKFVEG